MKKNVILILFILLYLFNYEICNYLYSGGFDRLTMEEWSLYGNQWTSLRYNLYEFMFMLVLVSGFVNPNKYSRSISLFIIIIIFFSLIDKVFSDIVTRHLHDIVVIGFSGFVSTLYFIRYENS